MTNTLLQAEEAVRQLDREELSQFREWFAEFDADAWDRQMEEDAQAGRLDKLAEEALREYHEGRTTEL